MDFLMLPVDFVSRICPLLGAIFCPVYLGFLASLFLAPIYFIFAVMEEYGRKN